MAKKFEIQNSTAEFLIFQIEGTEDGMQVVYRDESIWCTQKAIAQLFDVGVSAISKLLNIFKSKMIVDYSVIFKMETITTRDYRQYSKKHGIRRQI